MYASTMSSRSSLFSSLLIVSVIAFPQSVIAQLDRPAGETAEYASDVLPPEKWDAVDRSIVRALDWLASQQQRDGSFPTQPTGQPAITSLCAMAFMSGGHVPGEGRYGDRLQKALDYVLSTQREQGLFSREKPVAPVTSWHRATHTAMYNHAIAGLILTEAYGMSTGQNVARLTDAIEKGLKFSFVQQRRPGPYEIEDGGWRYLKYHNIPNKGEADLSVTAWHMMFLRSAANAGFDVPTERMEAAVGYVQRSFDDKTGQFRYGILPADRNDMGRGMTGAGVLCLAMGGKHDTPMALRAGEWLLEHPVDKYNVAVGRLDRFHYGVHFASHAMYQLGGKYWDNFYPTMAETFLGAQLASGAWPRDSGSDRAFGNCYTTALAILSLTPPYQVLPIYQR